MPEPVWCVCGLLLVPCQSCGFGGWRHLRGSHFCGWYDAAPHGQTATPAGPSGG